MGWGLSVLGSLKGENAADVVSLASSTTGSNGILLLLLLLDEFAAAEEELCNRWLLRPNPGLAVDDGWPLLVVVVEAPLLLSVPSTVTVAVPFLPLAAFAAGVPVLPLPFLLLGGRERDESLKWWTREGVLLNAEEEEEVKKPAGRCWQEALRWACCRKASSRCMCELGCTVVLLVWESRVGSGKVRMGENGDGMMRGSDRMGGPCQLMRSSAARGARFLGQSKLQRDTCRMATCSSPLRCARSGRVCVCVCVLYRWTVYGSVGRSQQAIGRSHSSSRASPHLTLCPVRSKGSQVGRGWDGRSQAHRQRRRRQERPLERLLPDIRQDPRISGWRVRLLGWLDVEPDGCFHSSRIPVSPRSSAQATWRCLTVVAL